MTCSEDYDREHSPTQGALLEGQEVARILMKIESELEGLNGFGEAAESIENLRQILAELRFELKGLPGQ